jgi:hypothetical protein
MVGIIISKSYFRLDLLLLLLSVFSCARLLVFFLFSWKTLLSFGGGKKLKESKQFARTFSSLIKYSFDSNEEWILLERHM